MAKNSQKRFARFSVRALLIALTAFAIWLGVEANRARKQHRAVAWVVQHGGWVKFDWERKSSPGNPPGPSWLRELIGDAYFQEVEVVSLAPGWRERYPEVTNVLPLSDLRNLRALYLSGTKVTDVSPLRGLARLETLTLDGTRVSDVAPLKDMKNLNILWLPSTISDAQVADLQRALPECNIGRMGAQFDERGNWMGPVRYRKG